MTRPVVGTADPAAGGGPAGTSDRRLRALVVAVLAAPLLVGAVRALLDDGVAPSGDVALMEVRVRDVGSATPLLGSYGRYGFNHPGPLLFYVLAVPYRLLGGRFAGMEVGTLLLGVLSTVAIAWVAHRRGGAHLLLWVGLLLAVLVHGVGPTWVANPWEPHGLLLPCAALVLLSFDATAGRSWTLPLVALLASLLAQAQATLLPFATALVVLAAGAVAATAVRDRDRRTPALRALAATAVLTALLWAPPLVEEVTREPGNLTAMARARDRPEPVLGLADGARLVAQQLGVRAPWLGWATPLDGLDPVVDPDAAETVPVGAVALAAALVVAARRRLHAGLLALCVAVGIVAGALALSRLLGPTFVWIPQWTRVLGFACWAAVGWVVASAAPPTVRQRAGRVVAALLVLGTVGLSLANATRAATDDRTVDPLASAVARLTADAVPTIGALAQPVLVSSGAAPEIVFGTGQVGLEALVLDLERGGVDTVVAADLADRYGPERARPGRARSQLRLGLARDAVPEGFRVVGTADPLPPRERAERAALLRSIGLGDDATLGDVVLVMVEDPSVRPVWERLRAYSDLPPFVLLAADGPPA